MIRAVIFDFGGVMVPKSVKELYIETGKAFNLDPTLVRKVWKSLEEKVSNGQMTLGQFWQLMAEGLNVSDAEKIERIWRRHVYTRVMPVQKMVQLVKDLKEKGYIVAVLSNVMDIFADFHKVRGHYKIFDALFLSHEIGMAKPDLKIYKHTVEKLGVKPEECVFIDDKKENLTPAKELGMHTILFQSVTQVRRELEKIL